MNILKKIEELYDKQIHASGLAIFRIFYSIVFFCEIAQLFYFRQLVFDYIPYLQPYEINFAPALIMWMVTILFLIFGVYTRVAAIINYLFSLTLIGTINTFEYHMFYVYMGVNFLLIFTNVSQVYSIDRLREKLRSLGSSNEQLPKETASVLNYYILVLVGIGFVYFDSILYKFGSDVWLSGLGLWLPASLPPFTYSDTSFILNIKWLALGLGYLTLVFETIFIFVFFRKKWRPWLFLIGVGLHLGIVIKFPIPWFGLGVAALYCLLVPVSFWQKIEYKLSFSNKSLIIFYDQECLLCRRTKIVLEHFDFFNALKFKSVQQHAHQEEKLKTFDEDDLLADIYSIAADGKVYKGIATYAYAFRRMPLLLPLGLLLSVPGIKNIAKIIYRKIAIDRSSGSCTVENCGLTTQTKNDTQPNRLFNNLKTKDLKVGLISVGIALFVLFQINISYNSLLANRAKEYLNVNQSYIGGEIIQKVSNRFSNLSKMCFGIAPHAVFMDYHFDGFNHNIAIVFKNDNGKDIWLPIINKMGQPSYYNTGPNWVKWTFRVNSQNIRQSQLKNGLQRFTAFWAVKNNKEFEDLTFKILVRKIKPPQSWEKNYLRKQMNKGWEMAGNVYWQDRQFSADIKNIEKM